MDTLKTKLIKTITEILEGNKPELQKEIYFHKVILPPANESIFFSFRFHNKYNNYFILSVLIQLKETNPIVECNLSLLHEKRFFFKSLYRSVDTVEVDKQFPKLIEDEKVLNYYKFNRELPLALLREQYNLFIKNKLDKLFDVLEKDKIEW